MRLIDAQCISYGVMTIVQRLWKASPPLTAAGLLMVAALVASAVGLAVDPREILGAPRWLKPAKFAVSIAIYAFTLAWIFTYLPDRRRLTTRIGWVTAGVLVLEVAIIDLQAARGVASHFNIATPLDAALFATMGGAILAAWVAAITLCVALFRHRFADGALGWALRIGMLLTVIGQGTGWLMTSPTREQLAAARTSRMTVGGAHTVDAPDGGPGLPIVGWSRDHGDLRVPHFVGMHAIQALPAVALLLVPIAAEAARRRTVFALAAAYAALYGVLLAQALGGHPVLWTAVSR